MIKQGLCFWGEQVIDKIASGGGHMFAQLGTRELGKAVQKALGPKKDRAALEPAATLEDGLAALVNPLVTHSVTSPHMPTFIHAHPPV
jgi:hypothetical protein